MASKTNPAATGYTAIGTISNTQAAKGSITSKSTPSTIPLYTNIYAETSFLTIYSADNGTNWGYMLSPQGGWNVVKGTSATATTADGTMYQATGAVGTTAPGSGAATLIYSSDGIHWSQVATFPTNDDWVQSVFAVGDTVYVGTGHGYVYFTTNHGSTWNPNTPAQVPDDKPVNAIVVDMNGVFYAGTAFTGSSGGGHIYYSQDSGQSWSLLASQPSVNVSVSSLAIDTNGVLYAVMAYTATTPQPQYNTAPLTTGTWQLMALPNGDGHANAIAATGTTVYVGTSNSYVLYTSNKGATWAGSQIPGDSSGITSLFVTKNTLSPLFVESYGVMQLTSSHGRATVTVKNLSTTTVKNVQADSTQLPENVSQISEPCSSVAYGKTCSITFAANGTNAFTPTAFNIIDYNGNIVSRSALVSSITPNEGANYYYVYNVNGTSALVIGDNDVSNGVIWGSGGALYEYTSIWGVAENSTTTVPYPNSTQPTGQTATQYSGQQNCNGATNGICDSTNIHIYYSNPAIPVSDYAVGLCYADTQGGAAGTGQWYLPSACELNGGIYFNATTNQFASCSPVLTSFFSLYSLGALGGPLSNLLSTSSPYWSSAEFSLSPKDSAWFQTFYTGGGSVQSFYYGDKSSSANVRCSQALNIS